MERFKLMKLQPIWGNRCNNELCQKLPFLPLNQRAVGSTPTRPTKFFKLCVIDEASRSPNLGLITVPVDIDLSARSFAV